MKKLLGLLIVLVSVTPAFGYTPEEVQKQIDITNDAKVVQRFYIGGVTATFSGYALLLVGASQSGSNPTLGGSLSILGLLGLGIGGVVTFVTEGDLYDLLRRQAALNEEMMLAPKTTPQ